MNTKERNNERGEKMGFLWFSLAGAGGGDAELRNGLVLQSSPHKEKDPFFQEPRRGLKAILEHRPERKHHGGIPALGRACYRSERGAEQQTSGRLGCRPVPGCRSNTAGSVLDCSGEKKCWRRGEGKAGLSA